ncbi:conserved hypothetical protein [Bosea sp. 62]|uniref:hypothetical protein n=1 Tax=unclassified Bosea (in: a-proteobacteria) TaxID=2653178 RepID=UPI001258B88C|nr:MULTISPECIES: hypothetical protein [unclassified Bosea (in: a-proteobacteria)]CAD5257259.1 conserved hypothetical protein [Bosea sp. 7B]CAD5273027.1 conserved hypothetical protein [Bosea sp. 21B]CAD5285106.1 conserved hypothetical protein [Bosea sp. 46]VVT60253.1 conserved hypothetical protein [Bosea sp. EC-HK365B]VXB61092.1 conserved hypothetical protein [Bosea sp. 62]
MKEQYVGDVNDYRKYALLRLLARSGLRLGVCWMLTRDDASGHGNKLGYLDLPKQEAHDPELHAIMRTVRETPRGQRLGTIEASGVLARAIYFNEIVPEALFERQLWFRRAGAALANTDLIFFDPDNGIEVRATPKGRKRSSKYVYHDELRATYAAGHSLLVYQHFPMKERASFIQTLARDLHSGAPGAEIWAILTSNVVFMLAIQQRHRPALSQAAHHVLETADPSFLHAQLIAPANP